MSPEVLRILGEIGRQIDRNRLPLVYDGGFVLPGKSRVGTSTSGKETGNASEPTWKAGTRQQGSSRPWSQSRTWPRSPARSRTTGTTAPVIDPSLQEKYEDELDALGGAYPNARIWHQTNGMWLLTNSTLVSGLSKTATFLTAIPFYRQARPKSWGFWTTPISSKWIGPRHTNFPDGSICAFEPTDGTWNPGDSIINLLDIYSVWAVRHLHLEAFGRWPGFQSVPFAYERITEFRDDEFCGCGNSDKLYAECCKESDLAHNQKELRDEFWKIVGPLGLREPPKQITDFISTKSNPPHLEDLL